MVNYNKPAIAFLFSFLGLLLRVSAFNYQEHKLIGNTAFEKLLSWLQQNNGYPGKLRNDSFFLSSLAVQPAPDNTWYFSNLSHPPNYIGYGDLNAVSGDHETDPLSIADDLKYAFSKLNKAVAIQESYGKRFYTNAPDKTLFFNDETYGFYALLDLDHFYQYGKGLKWHLNTIHRQLILDLLDPKKVGAVFQKLRHTNAIAVYGTLHIGAEMLAQKAGHYFKEGQWQKGRDYLFYAMLFNAYADHFLQDAFAAGHLLVNRSVWTAVINNKSLHDFYSKEGIEVENLRGDRWYAYGDNHLLEFSSKRFTATGYADLAPDSSKTFLYAVEATTISLKELTKVFFEAYSGNDEGRNFLPDENASSILIEKCWLSEMGALKIIPLPFGSDAIDYFEGFADAALLAKGNQIPLYRNYVRQRVANTLQITTGTSSGNLFKSFDNDANSAIGVRFVLSSGEYHYHNVPQKYPGLVDQWMGTSFIFLHSVAADKILYTQTRIGKIRYFDIWLSSTRFIDLTAGLDAGIHIQQDMVKPMAAISAGLDVLPLLGFNRKRIPRIISIPLQLLLPLKPLLTYQVITGLHSQWVLENQLDILF